MKKGFYTTALLLLGLVLVPVSVAQEVVTPDTNVETEKRAQTGMKFLALSVDARAAALGGAVTADFVGSSASMFYNPASMAFMPGQFHANLGQTQFISDITYNIGSIAFKPSTGNYGVFGLSVTSVDYGEFIGTSRANNQEGFIETGNFKPTALAVGLGYARAFSDRFSAGVHVKYALQDLGKGFPISTGSGDLPASAGDIATTADYSANTVAFDFGVVYATGFRSLILAFSARNFAPEQTYVRERFELPLTFNIGLAMNLMDLTSLDPSTHALNVQVDARRPRDFNEHIRLGLEYGFREIVFLRGGLEQLGISGEEQGVSLGAGLQYQINNIRFGADYAWTDFGVFSDVHRFRLQFGL